MSKVGSTYGVDVAIRRADDLDKLILTAIAESTKPLNVLDLGSGEGGQSARMVLAGARVTAIDILHYEASFTQLHQQLRVGESELQFRCGDILALVPMLKEKYHIVCMQRTLHYVTYDDAQTILRCLTTKVTEKMYISVTGRDSAIGKLHPLYHEPIERRFGALSTEAAETFSIRAPLCVYTKAEFITLLTSAGWDTERIWMSAFGNIKVIARPAA